MLGKLFGAITGSTKAAKKAAAESRAAADLARFKPFDIEGSVFGDVEFGDDTAKYALSPELTKIRDRFFEGADYFGDATETASLDASKLRDYGRGLFDSATSRDTDELAGDYYRRALGILEPSRIAEQTGLANNLFNTGREGLAITTGAGGYVNPDRMAYLTAKDRQDERIAFESMNRARNENIQDINRAVGLFPVANAIQSDPYNYMNQMFGYGSGVELQGQQPMMLGMSFGQAAQPGRMAQAQGYSNAAQIPFNASLANAAMGMNFLTQGFKSGMGDGGFFSNLLGGPTPGYSGPSYATGGYVV